MAAPALVPIIAGTIKAVKIIGATLAATSVASDVYHQTTDKKDGQRDRRSPDRYQPTSFDYALKGGLSPIDSVQQIGGIVNLGTLQKLNTVPTIKPFEVAGYTRQQRYTKQQQWNELTDPLNLNSFSDVLLNQEGKAQRMSDLGLTNTPLNLPGIRTIVLGVDTLKNQVLDPALKGEGGKLFMNLTNWLGEDMDTIDGANLVKGLVLEKDKSKVFTRALGFGKEGKYTYDYSIYNPEMGFMESLGKGKSMQIEEIEFQPGTSEFLQGAEGKLRRLRDFMALNAEVSIEIQGHVHATNESNGFAAQKLSEARAKRVMNYLATNGIDKTRMEAIGYGNTKPIYPNPKFAYEEQANRRVEIVIK
jgi:outer membrane protein OmpA-like peptidoglycan-associated protein